MRKSDKNISDPTTKWKVDIGNGTSYYRNGTRCYLTKDGRAGFAIKANGDVVGLFGADDKKGAASAAIPIAIALGGRKLDCYATPGDRNSLHDKYARFGARSIAKNKFNTKFASKRYHKLSEDIKNKTTPPMVVAMTLPQNVNEAISTYKKYSANPNEFRKRKDITLLGVKEFKGDNGYFDMIEYRDKKLARQNMSKSLSLAIRSALGSGA